MWKSKRIIKGGPVPNSAGGGYNNTGVTANIPNTCNFSPSSPHNNNNNVVHISFISFHMML